MRRVLLVALCVFVTVPLFAQKRPVRHGSKADYDTVLAGGYNVRDSLARLRTEYAKVVDSLNVLKLVQSGGSALALDSITHVQADLIQRLRDSASVLRSRDTALVNPAVRAAQRAQDSATATRAGLANETYARTINETSLTDQLDNLFAQALVQNDTLTAHKAEISALQSSVAMIQQSLTIVGATHSDSLASHRTQISNLWQAVAEATPENGNGAYYTGVGVPHPSLGGNGDSYWDTLGLFEYRKSGGRWRQQP